MNCELSLHSISTGVKVEYLVGKIYPKHTIIFTTANNGWSTAKNVIPTLHKRKRSATLNKCTTSNN